MPKPRQNRSILAQRLRHLRTVADLTQTEVADMLGVRRDTYANYEVGRCAPNAETRKRLAAIYNIDPEMLLQPDGVGLVSAQQRLNDSSFASARGIAPLPGDEKMLISLYRLLVPKQQEQLLDLLAKKLRDDDTSGFLD